MSRLISQAQTLGSNAQIRRIYRASLYIFLTIGTIGSLGMLLFAKQLAIFMEAPDAWVCMLALAPARPLHLPDLLFPRLFPGPELHDPYRRQSGH